jgi:hypothetical protein
MPRAARRRLIALAIAIVIGLLTTCASWLVSIGYFSSVNAPDESLALRKAARQALADITEYRQAGGVDDATYRAAVVRAEQIHPLRQVLKDAAYRKLEHRWSIGAAYKYHLARQRFIVLLEQLENFRTAMRPTTTRDTP